MAFFIWKKNRLKRNWHRLQVCRKGASVVTVLGMSEVCIENYSGITEYTDTLVRIRTKHGQIQLKGSCLEIEFYTNDEMKITGSINLIEFQEGRNLR